MKTKEELNALKEEFKNVRKKLTELTDEELMQVTGGVSALDSGLVRLLGEFIPASGARDPLRS